MKPNWPSVALWTAGIAGAGTAAYFVLRAVATEPEHAPVVPAGTPAPLPVSNTQRTVTGYVKGAPVQLAVKDIGGGKLLRSDAADAYTAMVAAARAAGIELVVVSAWRSQEEQRVLYDGWKSRTPGYNLAAVPGYSNHQAGLSVDLNTGSYVSATYRWLFMNAGRFGFKNDVLTEHWHWTYVGSASFAGLGGLSTAEGAATSSSLAQWALPGALAVAVVYQVFVRKDEGPRTVGKRLPDPKASAQSKRYARS